MGNEISKPEQAPESENAVKLRAVFTNIENISKEYDEREAGAQIRRARKDAKQAAAMQEKIKLETQMRAGVRGRNPLLDSDDANASVRTQALAQRERLIERQKAKAAAATAAIATAVKSEDKSEDSVRKQTDLKTPLTSSAPNTPVEAHDTLAGWNTMKEPRLKSSSGNDQTQNQRRRSPSSDVEFVRYGRQEPSKRVSKELQPERSKQILPKAKKNADRAKASTLQNQSSKPQGALPSKPNVTKASSIVKPQPGNNTILPTLGGKKHSLPTKPESQGTAPNVPAKRAEPASGFGQYSSLSGLHAEKRPRGSVDLSSSITSPRSPVTPGNEAERQAPDWYRKMSVVLKRGSNTGNADALLDRLKEQITTLKKLGFNAGAARMNELRESLHESPFLRMGAAGPQLLRNKRMLHNNDGLPQLFDDRYAVPMEGHRPWDVRSDAAELYHKWCSKNFDDDILFGLILAQ